MFLSPDQMRELTGYRQPSRQRAWLIAKNLEFVVNASGDPRVTRDTLCRAHGIQTEPEPPPRVVIPPLDREAVYRPLAEIRARRELYRLGSGGNESGIYFLFTRWALLYVGQSKYIGARLRAHFMKRLCARQIGYTGTIIWFNKVTVIDVPECWLNEVEAHYISTLCPPYNIRGVPL